MPMVAGMSLNVILPFCFSHRSVTVWLTSPLIKGYKITVFAVKDLGD